MIAPRVALADHYGVAESRAPVELGENVARVGDYVVKQFADRERALREAELLAVLAAPDPRYRVQQLVRTTGGAAIAELAETWVLVTRWRDGEQKSYTLITTPEWEALGRELGALHVRLDDFTGPLPRASELALDVAAERSALVTSPTRADATIARYLDARLALLDAYAERGLRPPPVPERPIHNDYNQHNYLFDGELPPIILDWEGAIAAPREYEVVRCMNHLPLVAPPHASAFVGGYHQVRPLDRAGLRWGVDRSLLDHAVKSWPLERWLAKLPGAERTLAGSMEVLHALHEGIAALERFYGVEGT